MEDKFAGECKEPEVKRSGSSVPFRSGVPSVDTKGSLVAGNTGEALDYA
jgi:hypothetical protein